MEDGILYRARTRRARELARDERGANLVEYIIAVGVVALVAIIGFRAFGATVTRKVSDQADCVAALDGSGCASNTRSTSLQPTNGSNGDANRADQLSFQQRPPRGGPSADTSDIDNTSAPERVITAKPERLGWGFETAAVTGGDCDNGQCVPHGQPAGTLFKTQVFLTAALTIGELVTPGALAGRVIADKLLEWARIKPPELIYDSGLGGHLSWLSALPPGYLYVLAHGDPNGPTITPSAHPDTFTADPLPVDRLSNDILSASGYRKGMPVVLISCNTGNGDYPQSLADAIGADVYAPAGVTDLALLTPLKASKADWRVFHPHR